LYSQIKFSCIVPAEILFITHNRYTIFIAALGKGDKKVYVVPGLDLVVRHGDDKGDAVLGPSSFEELFWAKLKLAIK
jgi:hypothetical protein